MKTFKTNPEEIGFHSIAKKLFGYAKPIDYYQTEFETPHGKVEFVQSKNATKEQRNSTKPFPGECKIDGSKYYILFK